MKKNMYSLMLSQSIMQEIDKMAYRLNTNRSNLINQILAEYVSFETPEKRIKSIFERIAQLIESTDFVLLSEGHSTLSLKSPLAYKYRPTIKYSLEMSRTPEDRYIGMLKVSFRTQSAELLAQLDAFFAAFIALERAYIHPLFEEGRIQYEIESGRFKRSFPMPICEDEDSIALISTAISSYISTFDDLLKWYLYHPDAAFAKLEKQYLALIKNKIMI